MASRRVDLIISYTVSEGIYTATFKREFCGICGNELRKEFASSSWYAAINRERWLELVVEEVRATSGVVWVELDKPIRLHDVFIDNIRRGKLEARDLVC